MRSFELLNEIIMQQSLLDLIDGGLPLMSYFFEARPDQQRAGDVIALDARFATLTLLNEGQSH